MMFHSITLFHLSPLSLLKLWLERIAANGIRRVQVMDASNDMSFRMPEFVQFARGVGLEVAVGLVYSYSPKHTDEYYAQKTRDAAALNADVIYLKDSGGLLTPDRTRSLIPAILASSEGLPIEFHSHCTTGLAPICYLEAAKLGIRTLHTAIPPLANGPSLPSVLNVARNLRLLGYKPCIDEEAIKPISDHFGSVAEREGLPKGVPIEYDVNQYLHQIPGGVISNLKHQLSGLRMGHQLQEVLEEVVRTRQDLGYPIMVTPFSQFVVSQAAMNVMLGERYKQVTDEIIKYTLGYWGKEASSSIDENVKDRILNMPRAKELSDWRPPEQTIEEVRKAIGGPGVSDEELLLRYILEGDKKAIEAMRAAGPTDEYTSTSGVLRLIQRLLENKNPSEIFIQNKDFSLTLK
jgi:oxaloacetate decarboxylase (Na+ extruding) subunit alpha